MKMQEATDGLLIVDRQGEKSLVVGSDPQHVLERMR